jgi:cytochrome P450
MLFIFRYLSRVIEESLRLSATGPFAARVAENKEIRISGHLIPPGTPIVKAIGVSLRDEKYFPDPDNFDPDRFLPENTKKRPNLAFVPFGVGQRRCPGYKFAKFEAIAVASVILRTFELIPAFENDIFIQPVFAFVTKPETEIWLKLKRRTI